MRKLIVEFVAASALTLAAALALASQARACPAIKVSDAFARASATPQTKSGAAYVSLANESSETVRLVSLSTSRAGEATLHQTVNMDGTMKMSAVDGVDLAPGQKLAMAPGGLHVMLFGLAKPLRRGETLDLMLTFSNGCAVAADVPVGSVAQASAEGG